MTGPARPADPSRPAPVSGPSESTRTVVVALVTNLGVALAKIVAAVLTGSVAMLAEAWHAVADTGNQVLLLVAQRPPLRRSPSVRLRP